MMREDHVDRKCPFDGVELEITVTRGIWKCPKDGSTWEFRDGHPWRIGNA